MCIHGTYSRNLESILKIGLKRMKRLHVHFSCGLPADGEVISGNISFIMHVEFFLHGCAGGWGCAGAIVIINKGLW